MLSRISPLGTPPATLPVSIERAKEHLRLNTDDFNNELNAILLAASATVEDHTGRALIPSLWEWTQDYWPKCNDPIELPLVPVREVLEIAYRNELGYSQYVNAGDWKWRRTNSGAELWFTSNYSFPTLNDNKGTNLVTVRFRAGYGDSNELALALDPRLEMAVLFLVGTWFENRENVQSDEQFEVPETFKYLVNQLRIFR